MENIPENENRAAEIMLISVGGSPAPIVKSIEMNCPGKLIFFVSRGSYESITAEILPAIMRGSNRLPQHETVLTPDEQDLGKSTFALLSGVPEALKKLGSVRAWPDLVDFTGGTKGMSAALVWASSRHACRFSYIGSVSDGARTKKGLGIVIDGKERCLLTENPWNEIAYFDVQNAVALFNSAQYANAVVALEKNLERVSDPRRLRLLKLLLGAWRGYAAWDMFDHRSAVREFSPVVRPLLDIAAHEDAMWPGLLSFAEANNECFAILKDLSGGRADELSWAKVFDLLSNAVRRARLENKYEDAVARCYAAIEKYAKHALKTRHGIDNAACRPEQLPETLHAEYTKRYSDENKTEKLKFGLNASYKLLCHLGDPVGICYEKHRDELEKLLPLRNNSILGHGAMPVSSDNFERLLNVALNLMDADETCLTVFPVI